MKKQMKHILTAIGIGGILLLLSGCELFNGSLHGLGRGAPELNKDGKFADSTYNREYFERRVRKNIQDEQNQVTPEYDWKRAWRVSFDAMDRSSENPEQEKRFIIKLRKEAGLPIWPFMLH